MNLLKKPKIRNYLKRILMFALPILSTLFIVGTTTIIIIIINGYSIDINKRVVIKTGVLNVETNPADADISINGEYYGKSNRAIPNIEIGDYTVTLSRDGYFPYTKKMSVLHGLASPLIVSLLRTDEKEEVLSLSSETLFDFNSTGYYIVAKNVPAEGSTSPTPTATKVKAKAENSLEYTLSRVYVSKSLFDDPHPSLDERMTLSTLSATPITGISVSPTGKLVLITLADKSGNKSLSLLPFKKNTSVNLNLTDTKALTNYAKDSAAKIAWSESGEYLVIATANQIISYNVKSGTRVILVEKSEVTGKSEPLIWSMTNQGIVLIKKLQGSKTQTYEITDITYNGDPLSVQIPTLTIEETPTNIWKLSSAELTPLYVVATKKGSFVLGKIYDTKSNDLDITQSSERLGGLAIEKIGDDMSKIVLSEGEIKTKPAFWPNTHLITFTENDNKKLSVVYLNKRIADKQTILGKKQLIESKEILGEPKDLINGTYVALKEGNALTISDTTGENVLTIQTDISTFSFQQNDSALLFTDGQKKLWFRVIL